MSESLQLIKTKEEKPTFSSLLDKLRKNREDELKELNNEIERLKNENVNLKRKLKEEDEFREFDIARHNAYVDEFNRRYKIARFGEK